MPRYDAQAIFEARKAEFKSYWGDGREAKLMNYIQGHPKRAQMQGDPDAIMKAIDEYNQNHDFLMIIGPKKGSMITDLIAQVKPKVMVECGSYVGYSALKFGSAVRAAGGEGAKYYCLELDPQFAAITAELVKLAGLDGIVQVIIGGAGDGIEKLLADGLSKIDLLFLDHMEKLYIPDLQLCEQSHLVDVGSVVVADNCVWPGAPDYLEYIRSTPQQKKEAAAKAKDAGQDDDLFGRPELRYENTTIEPEHGVEVSRCVAVDA